MFLQAKSAAFGVSFTAGNPSSKPARVKEEGRGGKSKTGRKNRGLCCGARHVNSPNGRPRLISAKVNKGELKAFVVPKFESKMKPKGDVEVQNDGGRGGLVG